MAGKPRKPPKANVIFVNASDAKEFADTIAHRISTAEVKTATPTRAQNKIQVRIAWTEPDGKPGLGYLSMDSGDAEKLGKKTSGPLIKNFIDDVFRVVQWAKAAAKKDYRTDDWAPFHEEVHDCLRGSASSTRRARSTSFTSKPW